VLRRAPFAIAVRVASRLPCGQWQSPSLKKGWGPTRGEAWGLAQSPNGIGGESHSAPPLGGLRLAEDETLAGQPLDRLLHVKDVGVQVHVLPPETQELALAQARHDSRVYQGGMRRVISHGKEAANLFRPYSPWLVALRPRRYLGSGFALGLKSIASELMQYLLPVSVGPSSKTWPR
jgi:hypothetical protein